MLKRFARIFLLAALMGSFYSSDSLAQLKVSRLFADGMVLQRDAAVPVWGWAPAGQEVEVEFGRAAYAAETAPDGTWSVTLPPMPAGGTHTMTIRAGEERVDGGQRQ